SGAGRFKRRCGRDRGRNVRSQQPFERSKRGQQNPRGRGGLHVDPGGGPCALASDRRPRRLARYREALTRQRWYARAVLAFERHGEGPPLVLLHGITQSRGSWAPLLPTLSASHDVLAIDLKGHGESSADPPFDV